MSSQPIAVITGGASGIGKELVRLYILDHLVIALDLSQESLESLKEEFPGVIALSCDVSKLEELKTVAEKIISSYGTPTIWFNNAGIAVVESFREFDLEKFDQVLKVNINGVVYGTRVAMEKMGEEGVIVNMASVNGYIPAPYMTAYGASKHAVVGFTAGLQQELEIEKSSLRVVLVAPGFVETPIVHAADKLIQNPLFEKFRSQPETVAAEIKSGIESGKGTIFPTLNGKLMIQLNKLSPQMLAKGGRFFLSKNWKDFFKS
ncbi:MAG: SDR family oxidoreductase [Halobacteriovoraceae bacterium]|jgi:short-subunit dehydrogenase|nr:SDR family oxidoreductase [Halobacteriovoraceae bacterium]MBT5094617.1 SDR family oxidoreductase [Halobacteriovoraceae bacterium]